MNLSYSQREINSIPLHHLFLHQQHLRNLLLLSRKLLHSALAREKKNARPSTRNPPVPGRRTIFVNFEYLLCFNSPSFFAGSRILLPSLKRGCSLFSRHHLLNLTFPDEAQIR
ncbi:hypothetical protein TNCT_514241 [Trichonephila clavata]|uniref:Uncharacterized protein n=1 Tax=Trichonephila clavata TaxID=2740835 RepID=A0A8X6IT90_TRICU|nr:hypothetical protein TNCT_514241 [Trichonephila clavata]